MAYESTHRLLADTTQPACVLARLEHTHSTTKTSQHVPACMLKAGT